MIHDLTASQRTPDKDSPAYMDPIDQGVEETYFTLGPAGTINAFLENVMDNVNWDDGSLSGEAGDGTISGKILFPKSGTGGPMWGVGGGVPFVPCVPRPLGPFFGWFGPGIMDSNPPSITPSYTPPGRWIMWGPPNAEPKPLYPRIDPDPHFSPKIPWLTPDRMPEYPGPGTAITADSMMSAGYNDPNFGLPSDGGGSFMGPGTPTSCIMPMTPSTPVGGLFGPDAYAPFWGNPPSSRRRDYVGTSPEYNPPPKTC